MWARLGPWLRSFRRWATPGPRMTRVCAWCETVIEFGGPIKTHGICGDCQARFFPQTQVTPRRA